MLRHASLFLLAFTALLLVGCSSTQAPAQQVRIACVGDSITFGATIPDRETNSYPAQLGALLGYDYEVKNFGVNGATMLRNGDKPYWDQPQFQAAQDFAPDIVILMLGTNDTKPQNWAHQAQFEQDTIDMIRVFQGLESEPAIWICRPVPVFPERWGISDQTVRQGVIPRVDSAAQTTGAGVINLYAVLEGKPELVPDLVHPNVEGAGLMAQAIAEALREAE